MTEDPRPLEEILEEHPLWVLGKILMLLRKLNPCEANLVLLRAGSLNRLRGPI